MNRTRAALYLMLILLAAYALFNWLLPRQNLIDSQRQRARIRHCRRTQHRRIEADVVAVP